MYMIYTAYMFTSGRGGAREGSGRPSAWNNTKTVAIRVPERYSKQIIKYARLLDNEEISLAIDTAQNQKILQMLKDALNVPTNNFGKGKAILRKVISILENVQNQ